MENFLKKTIVTSDFVFRQHDNVCKYLFSMFGVYNHECLILYLFCAYHISTLQMLNLILKITLSNKLYYPRSQRGKLRPREGNLWPKSHVQRSEGAQIQ